MTDYRTRYETLKVEHERLRDAHERLLAQWPSIPPVVASGASLGFSHLFGLLGQRRDTLQPGELETRVQQLEAANAELQITNERLSRELSEVKEELSEVKEEYNETKQEYNETKQELTQRLSQSEQRLSQSEQRLSHLEQRLSQSERELTQLRNESEQELTQLRNESEQRLIDSEQRFAAIEAILNKICHAITAQRFAEKQESLILKHVFLPSPTKCTEKPYCIRTFYNLKVFLDLVNDYPGLVENGTLVPIEDSFESKNDDGNRYIKEVKKVCMVIEAVPFFFELPDDIQAKIHERMARLLSLYPDLVDWIYYAKKNGSDIAHQAFHTIEECVAWLESSDVDPRIPEGLRGLQRLDLNSIVYSR